MYDDLAPSALAMELLGIAWFANVLVTFIALAMAVRASLSAYRAASASIINMARASLIFNVIAIIPATLVTIDTAKDLIDNPIIIVFWLAMYLPSAICIPLWRRYLSLTKTIDPLSLDA